MSDVLDPDASTSAAFNRRAFAAASALFEAHPETRDAPKSAGDTWTKTPAWCRRYRF
jgi:hypothetical protein